MLASDEKPGGVGGEATGQRGPEREGETDLAFGGESTGGEQDWSGGKRDSELLHQDPGEEQQVAVGDQNMLGQCHGEGSCLRFGGANGLIAFGENTKLPKRLANASPLLMFLKGNRRKWWFRPFDRDRSLRTIYANIFSIVFIGRKSRPGWVGNGMKSYFT